MPGREVLPGKLGAVMVYDSECVMVGSALAVAKSLQCLMML